MSACCFTSKKIDFFNWTGFILDEDGEKVLPLEIIMRGLAHGTVMYKVKGPKRWYRRRYKVDIVNMKLSYSPSQKPFWKDKNVIIDIYDMDEVRKGWRSDVFNIMDSRFNRNSFQSAIHANMSSVLKEENCLSIICNNNRKVVDLIAPNMHTRDAWVRGLNHLIAICKNSHQVQAHNRWLKEQVRIADVNRNGCLNFNECLGLLHQLNISMDKKDALKLFNSANFRKSKIDNEDALDAEEFVQFYHSLTRRPELEELMKKHSVSRTTVMGAEELHMFMTKEQKVPCTFEEARMLIKKFEYFDDEQLFQQKKHHFLTLKGFQRMLLSENNDIFNKQHRTIYQDMTRPLNNYYIATSHNTYLIAGQLVGTSSIEGYIDALQRGCRCLELDTWDGPDGEPIVFHGYTLTSRIFLKDILVSIRDYAFNVSQYPVILSIENHCSLSYQVTMARYFVDILGEYLYTMPVGDHELDYPSPEQLSYKILIKAKKIKNLTKEDQVVLLLEEEQEKERQMAAMVHPPSSDLPPILEAPRHAGKIATELSDLVNYFSAVRFSTFQEAKDWKFQEMASFQETSALNLAAGEGKDFVAYNQHHVSRIYPKGTRTDSSNYDPTPFWNVGCQMVALNYQTRDKFMFLHDSKFATNGCCGYLLKPSMLCDRDASYDPDQDPDKQQSSSVVIRVITGQCIPKPNRATSGEVIDPYVVIKVSGYHKDEQKKKTTYIQDNGFDPHWNEMFLFTLMMPELAMFIFTVKDQNMTGKNETLGQFSLPFTSMTEGYRHIHLLDAENKPLVPASLFVHISMGNLATPSLYRASSVFSKNKS